MNFSRVTFFHVFPLLSIVALTTSALADSLIPEIKVGPFSNRMSLESAKALPGAKLECFRESHAEHSVEAACGVTIEDDRSHGFVAFGINGLVLEIVRYLPMATGLPGEDVLQQAQQKYQYLGQPEIIVPGPTLRITGDVFWGNGKSEFVPPTDTRPFGLDWTNSAQGWELRITVGKYNQEKPFSKSFPTERAVRVHYQNSVASQENRRMVRGKIDALVAKAVSKPIDF